MLYFYHISYFYHKGGKLISHNKNIHLTKDELFLLLYVVTREKGATALNCDCYIIINHRKYYSDNISNFSSILFYND